jgi:uncharacterized protein (DUF488 family)
MTGPTEKGTGLPMPDGPNKVLTIGHSTLSFETFLSMLKAAGVTAVVDVRSSPVSRRMPHFNRDELEAALNEHGVEYRFLGKELGGRPRASDLYCDGIADYEKMAREPAFETGLKRVIKGAKEHTIALMCSEHNPLDCHRCLLVGRALAERNIPVGHILSSGQIIEQRDIEEKLLALIDTPMNDMFDSHRATGGEGRLAVAYRQRSLAVAYREPQRATDRFAHQQWRDHAR